MQELSLLALRAGMLPVALGPAGASSLETWKKRNGAPNDADDVGQGGQRHQRPFLHFGPPSRPMASPCVRIFLCRTPRRLLGLLLKTVLAHDAELEGFGGPPKSLKNPSVACSFAFFWRAKFG